MVGPKTEEVSVFVHRPSPPLYRRSDKGYMSGYGVFVVDLRGWDSIYSAMRAGRVCLVTTQADVCDDVASRLSSVGEMEDGRQTTDDRDSSDWIDIQKANYQPKYV